MKGSAEVIEVLNDVVRKELTGINQYFVHAKMCENWGYDVLAEHARKESIDEMKHADKLIERFSFSKEFRTYRLTTRFKSEPR